MSEKKIKTSAIILAAGQGKRMGSKVAKQYMTLLGFPVLYYSLKAFEESQIDEIIVVTGQGEEVFCKEEIIDNYQIKKVSQVITGGQERYLSAFYGLCVAEHADYVLIHDGARPLVTSTLINQCIAEVQIKNACVVGMPVKDTIKIVDKQCNILETPDRNRLWMIQTPQCFDYNLIYRAYHLLLQKEVKNITDDAMVIETMLHYPVSIIEGSYHNIKITTPEDIQIAEILLQLSRKIS